MAVVAEWALHDDSPGEWVLYFNWRPFVVFLAECAKTDRTEEELDSIAALVEDSPPIDGKWFRYTVADNYRIDVAFGNGCDGRLHFRVERCWGPDELHGMINAAAWVMSRYMLGSQKP